MTRTAPLRRVVVGLDDQGRSAVVADGAPAASVTRASGAVVHEVWREETVPAEPTTPSTPSNDEAADGTMAPRPPEKGISVRVFTLPPEPPQTTAGRPLARTADMYVAMVVTGRAYLVLETSEVLLETGDTFILQGSLHAWRNPFEETAVMVATVYPLVEDPEG